MPDSPLLKTRSTRFTSLTTALWCCNVTDISAAYPSSMPVWQEKKIQEKLAQQAFTVLLHLMSMLLIIRNTFMTVYLFMQLYKIQEKDHTGRCDPHRAIFSTPQRVPENQLRSPSSSFSIRSSEEVEVCVKSLPLQAGGITLTTCRGVLQELFIFGSTWNPFQSWVGFWYIHCSTECVYHKCERLKSYHSQSKPALCELLMCRCISHAYLF